MPKIKTTEIFINESMETHGTKYDYSQAIYENSHKKVIILCSFHGKFKQTPDAHIRGNGCPKCGTERTFKKRRHTTEEFIKKSKEIHGDKYGYHKTVYINYMTKVKIFCNIHKIFFEQIPANHLRGHGCEKCANQKRIKKRTLNTNEFIKRARAVHGNEYDYSLVKYKSAKTKIKIKCLIHGIFEQTPTSHLTGSKCNECVKNFMRNKFSSNKSEFIKKVRIVHGDEYDYSLVKYINAKTKVKIICPEHGIFEQVPDSHINGNKCPICNTSKGEENIQKILIKLKIYNEKQKTFKDCKYKYILRFDFYLPEFNICIEYNGKQHYKPIDYFGGEELFKLQQLRDQIKIDFCKNNNISLHIIRYDENIDDRMKEILI